jgi:hypothetical protein
MSIFRLAAFERDRSITLYCARSIFGELAVSYCVAATADDRAHITVKIMLRYPGVWRDMRHVPPIGDWIMMRKQLRTLKKLAERDHAHARATVTSSRR